jgi:hypothetical protein
MRVHSSILILLIASSVLAALHLLALEFFLYWQYPWFDVPMHFLGGAIVALSVFAVIDFGIPLPKWASTIVMVLIFVLAIGIVWEAMETIAQISTRESNYVFDTALDLVMDLLGGFAGYVVGSRIRQLD